MYHLDKPEKMDSSPSNSKKGHSLSASDNPSSDSSPSKNKSTPTRRKTLEIPLPTSSPIRPTTSPETNIPQTNQRQAEPATQLPANQSATCNPPAHTHAHTHASHDYLGPNGLSPQQYRQRALGDALLQLHARLGAPKMRSANTSASAAAVGTSSSVTYQGGQGEQAKDGNGELGDGKEGKK